MKEIANNIIKKIIGSCLILLIGVVVGYFLLVLVFCIPISGDRYDIIAGTHKLEPYFPKASIMTQEDWLHVDSSPDVLDYSTDEYIIGRSLSNPDKSVFSFSVEFYPRYWGGYVTFFRPLFLFLDLSEVRVLIFILQFVLSIILAFVLYKKTNQKCFSLAWITVYMLLLPNTLALNFQYSSCFFIAVVSAIILTNFDTWFISKERYIYLFLIIGMCTSYFDFLTYPIFTWAISMVILLLLSEKNNKPLRILARLFISFISWASGYVVFWSSKWIISSIFSGDNIVLNAYNQIRLQGGSNKMNLLDRFDSFSSNWERLSFAPFILVLLVWVVFWTYSYIKSGLHLDIKCVALITSSVITFIWYMVIASKHTTDHSFFTWRNALSIMFAILVLMSMTVLSGSRNGGESKKSLAYVKRLPVVFICLLLSVFSYYLVPAEKTNVNNYMDIDIHKSIPAQTPNAYSYSFVPTHGVITRIESLLRSEDQEGYYELSVLDGEKVLYTERIDSKNGDSNILVSKVFWILKKGKEYTINISTEHIDSPVTMWFTDVPVLGELTENELYPLMGILYRLKFQRKTITIFYIMSWFVVYLLGISAIEAIILNKKAKISKEERLS